MENISTIKDRILTFLEFEGIKKADFYSTTGISDSNFKGKNLSSQLGGDAIVKVLTSYPNLSADWLLVGSGDMLKPDSNSIQTKLDPEDTRGETAISVPEGCHEGIPLVPLSAMAGAFSDETSVMEYECERYVIPAFKGADFLIQIKGDSMQPTYYSGDLVACQRMPLNDIFFQWNKAYVLDTVQGPLIKRIMPGSDADHVLIVSDNSNYPPFELHKAQFNGVALVRGLVRLE